MQENFWTNVAVDIQAGALGAAITINSISKANPAVVTYTGTDPAEGAVIVIKAQGMREVNGRAFRIANVDADDNTFELEDEDSTGHATFTSGSFQVATLGVSMQTVQGVSPTGGEAEFADLSTVHQDVRREAPTVSSASRYTLDCLWDMTDPAHVELRKASRTKTLRVVRFGFPSGVSVFFVAYVSAPGNMGGEAFNVVKTTVTLAVQGEPTVVA